MIERVRALCREDARLDAALMYGSFAFGEGDPYSDIEFLLFFDDAAFPGLDRRAWVEQIAPVELFFVNEFGITAVIFDNLIRGEFHFHSVSEMSVTDGWPGAVYFPSLEAVLIADKSGKLAPRVQPLIGPPPTFATPEAVQALADRFLNWWLFGFHVLRRGEYARALELLGKAQLHLLSMVRVQEGITARWWIPSRALEKELSPAAYARFAACTAPLDGPALHRAYAQAWTWGHELLIALHDERGVHVPEALCARITSLIGE
jgi:lincosamide nucleotidyltransferase